MWFTRSTNAFDVLKNFQVLYSKNLKQILHEKNEQSPYSTVFFRCYSRNSPRFMKPEVRFGVLRGSHLITLLRQINSAVAPNPTFYFIILLLKNFIFLDIMPCSQLKVSPCCGETCRLHIQGGTIRQETSTRHVASGFSSQKTTQNGAA
jgi:hypothetical protein